MKDCVFRFEHNLVSYRRNIDHTTVTSSDKELCGDDTQCALMAPSRFTQLIPETNSLVLLIMFLLTLCHSPQ